MLRKLNKNVPLNTELVAAALEPMAGRSEHPTTLGLQAVAAAVAPAVFPTERYRGETKAMMLREFARPKGAGREDAGTRDPLEAMSNHVVRVAGPHGSALLADLEAVDDDRAHEAVEVLERIVDRHERRVHHS